MDEGQLALKYMLRSVRPKQWTKNLLVFLALIFSMNLYWEPFDLTSVGHLLARTVAAFALFCLVSSSEYLINDLVDLENDRQHPQKRLRPLASGGLKPSYALITAVFLVALSLPLSFWLGRLFGAVVLGYVILMLLYSLALKHIVIIDVFTIAAGFVLRAVAGAVVINVPISPWLYICTVLGALFIGFSKRRHELVLLNNDAPKHRRSLEEYTPQLLEQLIAVVAPAAVIAYSLYTFSATNLPQNHAMMLTIPFVIYGIFRYLYLVHSKNLGGTPEEILLSDLPLIIDIALWVVASTVILFVYRVK